MESNMCYFNLHLLFIWVNFELNIIAVVSVSLWSFSLIRGEESQEQPSELICWSDPEFVKCLTLREITIAFICSVLHLQR